MKNHQGCVDPGDAGIELVAGVSAQSSAFNVLNQPDPINVTTSSLTPKTLQEPQQSLPHSDASADAVTSRSDRSKLESIAIIATLAGVVFLNSLASGVLISALPRIASDIHLAEGLLLWPAAVYSLTAGCLLLLFGAIADVVGTKAVWVTGSSLYMVFTLAVGLSRTGVQMIIFRACLGIAAAMCLPTAVSLITNTFVKGLWRNIAFALNGMGQPLGFALGLILGGVFTDTIGWRWSYYMSAIINACLTAIAVWVLPSVRQSSDKSWNRRLIEDIDWIGTIIISAALGILLYVLAMTASSYTNMSTVQNIVLLVLAVLMLCVFPIWIEFQVKHGRPALMPNKLWRNASFTATCIAVFFCWGPLNALEYFMTLFFQEVQELSALQSSLRFLPHVVAGVIVNVLTGFFVSKVNVRTLATISAIITLPSGLLMATVDVDESYWYAAFWAMTLSVVNADVLFTVSNLVISSAYPPELQALAGGVLNEILQFGNSVGIAVTAAIAASVTAHTEAGTKDDLMSGYRAAFWTVFAAQTLVVAVVFVGLRKAGRVGKKDE